MNAIDTQVQTEPKYMTARKFARYTGLPYRIVLEMVKSGELSGFKSGGKTNYILVESYKGLAHPLTAE